MANELSFSTPVLAIQAYSRAVDSDAKNMASIGAVAGTPFTTLISTFDSKNSSSGVQATTIRHLDQVGLPMESRIAQNFTIEGQGMVPVRDVGGNLGFVRNCTFRINENKDVVNTSDQKLMILRTDENGEPLNAINMDNLVELNVGGLVQDPVATSSIALRAQLNSLDAVGNTFDQSVTLYDSLGNLRSLNMRWTKTDADPAYGTDATQSWNLTITDPESSATIGAPYTGTGMRVEFDATGRPLRFNTQTGGTASTTPPHIDITWGGAAANSAIELNLGTVGSGAGIVSVGSESINKGFTSDGLPPGTFRKLDFDKDGYALITFSNDKTVKYGRVMLAMFDNVNGLNERSAQVFERSATSGDFTLSFPGIGNAGLIKPGTYEGSTVNGTSIYIKLIEDQKNLISNFKPIESIKHVFEKLEQL